MSAQQNTPWVPSGIDDLDSILGGLLQGDNVVWVTDQQDLFNEVESALLDATPSSERALHITGRETPAAVMKRLDGRVEVIDARSGSRLSDVVVLEQMIVSEVRKGVTRVIFDGLAPFANQWGPERALGFFKRICPRLFDLGAIAYWRVKIGRAHV